MPSVQPRAGTAFDAGDLYGRLHALEEACGGRYERRFAEAWEAARRKRVRRWTR